MGNIRLNQAQQQAVDHIYGPLLVLAGPGTGKTQLLSARIANILEKTDSNAQNILCLTFTEAAAQNMRERLASIIKDDAYDVHINTYHGFGSDIIRSYPEYFEEIDLETGEDSRLERPIDQLQQIQIIEKLVNSLAYDNPLIGARHYVKHVVGTISELKRGLYTPESLTALAQTNIEQITALNPEIAGHFYDMKSSPRTAPKALEIYSGAVEILEKQPGGLAEIALEELQQAMAEAAEINKSKPLTAWKNSWLSKDADNNYTFADIDQQKRMIELAKIYKAYEKSLKQAQLFDFDDMILRSINALQTKDDLRYTLQEKYQFILLDEFQDTNAAQFELVSQLGNNPVNEGQPNIFAVGDDDQAIYAFQGARVSNMLGFVHAYRDVEIINLTENYRSHNDIIHTAHNVAKQIESRLHHNLESVEKTLVASSNNLPKDATIERHEFDGQANEYAWVADSIKAQLDSGVKASEITILAPKHKLLEEAVPFLHAAGVPISYEKRENILDSTLIRSYSMMIELVLAFADDDIPAINTLLPRVLSLDFYSTPTKLLWQINWAQKTSADDRSWVEIAMDDEQLAPHVLFYVALGFMAHSEPLEYMLDYLTGSQPLKLDEDTVYTSPLKEYYFSETTDGSTLNDKQITYFESLANLSTIRNHLRNYQANNEDILTLQSYVDFVAAYRSAEQPLINTHPIATSEESVQLMTAYKSKGLEFEYVYLLSVHDNIWGKKARGNTNKLSLPANLQHIRYQGSSEDELRRLLFVAITRAKHGLYLTSHATTDSGKATEAVKYLMEFEENDQRKSTVLPTEKQEVLQTSYDAERTMQHVEILWQSRHLDLTAPLKALLKPRLDSYQMSPTHLNTFIDTEYGGPEVFLLQTLLRFPQAPGEDGEFGNAIHATFEWIQRNQDATSEQPIDIDTAVAEFKRQLSKRYIAPDHTKDYERRGENALRAYLADRTDMFSRTAKSEVDFRKEGVLLGDAHLSGKIDRLEVDTDAKTLRVVDYKTGAPSKKWDKKVKLLKYKQQLYFYKFLIEGSHTWKGYTVQEARLEFVEPDKDGNVLPPLTVEFDQKEEADTKALIQEVWKRIKTLDLPSHEGYNPDYYGALKFIRSIIGDE